MPQAAAAGVNLTGSNWVWAVSLITLLVTVLVARYAKGLISQLPLLFGVAAGLIASVIACAATGDWSLFRGISDEALASPFRLGSIFAVPAFSLPEGLVGGGAGHHANRHRDHPRVHGAYLPA